MSALHYLMEEEGVGMDAELDHHKVDEDTVFILHFVIPKSF